MKGIAAPENLESDVPVIQKAAEIKTQADLAQQTIKAIKYLGEVGCACHPQVKPALLASLDDCTEEVRHEAAMAFCRASGNPCSACGGSCCDEEVTAKLDDIANGTDENGCPKEPSSRVRAAAQAALKACRARAPQAPTPAPPDIRERAVSADKNQEYRVQVSAVALKNETGPADQSGVISSPDTDEGHFFSPDGVIQSVDGQFRVASYVQPVPQSRQSEERSEGLLASSSSASSFFTLEDLQRDPDDTLGKFVEPVREENPVQAGLGEMLKDAAMAPSTKAQRRSQISFDPNIRGFKAGQIHATANGVFWTSARRDLDTMLDKIDPGVIQDVVIIPGPYGLSRGPGFAFVDVLRAPTPRYEFGPESHFRASGNVRTNGGQVYGRGTVFGGGQNWGYRLSYGHRRGNDYRAGDGSQIPSSYNNRDIWGELSYDVNPHQRIDFAYQRLDQTDTEYPAQFFDVGYLGTYGFEARVVDEDPLGPWSKFSIEGWYNRTSFRGSTDNKRNRHFPVMQRVEYALDLETGRLPAPPAVVKMDQIVTELSGTTNGGVSSSGARAAVTFGDSEAALLKLGFDFRRLGQVIQEDFTETPDGPPLDSFYTNMPHSWLNDSGVYAELSLPMTDWWRMSLGARGDSVSTTARASDVRGPRSLSGTGTRSLEQDDALYAFYLQNEVELCEDWTAHAGFGQAQRPPTLVERYADGLFLGIVQSGFTRVVGDPRLTPEKNWQIDLDLSTEHDLWRARGSIFHSWVLDYVTMEDGYVAIVPPSQPDPAFRDARLVRFTNTDLATLSGFELSGEFDLLASLAAFGTMSYVQGCDQEIHAPLWSIPPLESTVGLRLHNPESNRRWGIELAARMVDTQNRLGSLRSGTSIVDVEEMTPSFTVWYLKGYWNRTDNLSFVAGIENLFDRAYQEHLDLRLLGPDTFPGNPTRVLSPGFTPYFGVDCTF